MSNDKFILDGHTPVPADLMTWAKWYEGADRHVAQETRSGVKVSTVFLGLNHQYGDGEPLLFETMIFGAAHNEFQDRCSTWGEAEAMHKRALEMAFGPQP